MWIYVETLPSTAWPISKNYWETSSYQIISTDAETGVIKVAIDDNSSYEMRKEHFIKEASTVIFLKHINNNNEDIQQTEYRALATEFFDKAGQYWRQALKLAPDNYPGARNWLKVSGRLFDNEKIN